MEKERIEELFWCLSFESDRISLDGAKALKRLEVYVDFLHLDNSEVKKGIEKALSILDYDEQRMGSGGQELYRELRTLVLNLYKDKYAETLDIL